MTHNLNTTEIVKAFEKSGKTVSAVAQEMNVSRKTLSNILNGKQKTSYFGTVRVMGRVLHTRHQKFIIPCETNTE